MSCDDCKLMDASLDSISVAAHESEMRRAERFNLRLLILAVILVLALIGSNVGWLIAWNQYDYGSESYEYNQDGRGINIIGDQNGAEQHGTETDDTP